MSDKYPVRDIRSEKEYQFIKKLSYVANPVLLGVLSISLIPVILLTMVGMALTSLFVCIEHPISKMRNHLFNNLKKVINNTNHKVDIDCSDSMILAKLDGNSFVYSQPETVISPVTTNNINTKKSDTLATTNTTRDDRMVEEIAFSPKALPR